VCGYVSGTLRCIAPEYNAVCKPDCAKGEVCKGGFCQKLSSKGCDWCYWGEYCDGNKCVRKPGCDTPCQEGEVCQNHRCIPIPCEPPCEAGFRCDKGRCVERPRPAPCSPRCQDGSCPVGRKCPSKRPERDCNPPCRSGETCRAGHCLREAIYCNPPCGEGRVCRKGVCVKDEKKCPDGRMYPSREACPPIGSKKAGETCQASKDCKPGLDCLRYSADKAHCFEKCSTDKDCKKNIHRKSCISFGRNLSFCVKALREGDGCPIFEGNGQGFCDVGLFCDGKERKCKRSSSYGQMCGPFGFDERNLCQSGLICLKAEAASEKGFCSMHCQKDSDCPSLATKTGEMMRAKCMPSSGGCIFQCFYGKPDCPKGLRCIDRKFCGP